MSNIVMGKLNLIWSLPRFYKRIISLLADSLFIYLAFSLAFWARLGALHWFFDLSVWYVIIGTIIITLFANIKLGLYRSILRYLTFHAFTGILVGSLISAISITSLAYFFDVSIPRSVPIIYLLFLIVLCGGSRLAVRLLLVNRLRQGHQAVLVIGAGPTGRQLAIALRQASSYRVRCFIDRDKSLKNTIIQGIPVCSVDQIPQLIKRYKINKVLLAIPRASRSERKKVIEQLLPFAVEVLTVPDFNDIVSGKSKVSELQDVAIGDLLGRDAVELENQLMQANIADQTVMVTGAGGSIGSELCRQIVKYSPSKIILFDHSEYNLYEIDKELSQLALIENLDIKVMPIIGSVQNRSRLDIVFKKFNVDTIFHTAAYKHVPLVEFNTVEGIRNNVFGTLNCVNAAIEANVRSFVLISTDKAVRPTNVMGASKRIAELILQAFAQEQSTTVFSMVRFGNVLGSSGSVIPLFRKQIANGGPVTVTHPEITRYFMTIPEASQLVIQAGAMGLGGDVFVLDMGKSIKIADLATKLIHLSGFSVRSDQHPHGDISIEYTGLRPGEKLYEELLIGDKVSGTSHDRIMSANEVMLPWSSLKVIIENLDVACTGYDLENIRLILMNAPTGFNPSDQICDLVWYDKNVLENRSQITQKVIPISYSKTL